MQPCCREQRRRRGLEEEIKHSGQVHKRSLQVHHPRQQVQLQFRGSARRDYTRAARDSAKGGMTSSPHLMSIDQVLNLDADVLSYLRESLRLWQPKVTAGMSNFESTSSGSMSRLTLR